MDGERDHEDPRSGQVFAVLPVSEHGCDLVEKVTCQNPYSFSRPSSQGAEMYQGLSLLFISLCISLLCVSLKLGMLYVRLDFIL